jgi:uncharacterized membrane protein
MRTTKFLFLVLLGFLTLARAQPDPGGPGEPGEEPQMTIDDIMEEIRDDQGVDRDDQLDPQACDPYLLEDLGDALMHKYFIVSSLRNMAEDVAKGITGAGPRRQHVQLGLAYVSAKVLGILAMLEGAGQSGTRELLEPPGGGDDGGGGLPGDTGEYAEGDTGDEGGDEEGGGEDGRGGSGFAGMTRNRSGGAGGSGFGGDEGGYGGSGGAEGYQSGGAGSQRGSVTRGGDQGSYPGRTGRAGAKTLDEGGASGGGGSASQGGYQGSNRSRGGGGGALAREEAGASGGGGEGARSGYQGSYRGRGAGAGGSSANEVRGASEGGYRGASAAGRSGGRGIVHGLAPELFSQIANVRWILLVVALVVVGTITVTFIRIARFLRRRARRHAAGQAAPALIPDPAMTLLKERFVKDEITKEEFEKKKRELEEIAGVTAEPDHKHKHPESKPRLEDVGGDVMEP